MRIECDMKYGRQLNTTIHEVLVRTPDCDLPFLTRDKWTIVTITDEDPEAALDAATEECAVVWDVTYCDIIVRRTVTTTFRMAYCAAIDRDDHRGDYAHGPSRVEAVQALTAMVKPRLTNVTRMSLNELALEATARSPEHQLPLKPVMTRNPIQWGIFMRDGSCLVSQTHEFQTHAWVEAVTTLRERDGE